MSKDIVILVLVIIICFLGAMVAYYKRKSEDLPSGVLIGKDAKRFLENMEYSLTHKATKEEIERMREDYEKIKGISGF